jgi:NitT/TauT family transport system ATP-binding protein
MILNAKAISSEEIIARDLTIAYSERKGRIVAVENLNFKITPGEFVCFLGTTGCGKSTILNVIAGFIKPTTGVVLMGSQPITGPGPERGFVFQQHALFSWKNVRGNVEFGLKMKGINRIKRATIADEFIRLVGLTGFEKSYPRELSGGMQQRVGLARTLANDPAVILMDEPFGSLDAQTRLMMQELLLNIWGKLGRTVVFVTHDVDEAIFLADRILILTSRPGKLKDEIVVSLPRPRSYEVMMSVEYISIKKRVLALIREETIKSMNSIAL